MIKFEHNPDASVTYGHWRCDTCKEEWHQGGEAMHDSECPDKDSGHSNCTFLFTTHEVERAMKGLPAQPLTRKIVEEQFPHLIPAAP